MMFYKLLGAGASPSLLESNVLWMETVFMIKLNFRLCDRLSLGFQHNLETDQLSSILMMLGHR